MRVVVIIIKFQVRRFEKESGSRDEAEEPAYVTSYACVLDQQLARQSGEADVPELNCGTPFQNLTEDVFDWTFTDTKEKTE